MHLTRIRVLVAASVAVSGLLLVAAPRVEAQAAKKKVLVVTLCKGFKHGAIPLGEKILAELGEQSGSWSVDYARTDEEVAAKMSPEGLKQYDAVCYENNTGLMPVPDRAAFIQWVKDGHAFFGMHAASDLMGQGDKWPEFLEMIGGQFRTHGGQCVVTVNVADRKHPATAHFTESTWTLPKEEIYLLRSNTLDQVRHLLYMTTYPMDGGPMQGKPGFIPVSWVRNFGQGRVFYTIFGHNDSVWNDDTFKKHITGGIEWALGLKPGDATPQAKTGVWVTE